MTNTNDILTTLKNGVRKITFNRPQKKNALNKQMYLKLIDLLNGDAKKDDVIITIITGNGDFYSSGNDFSEASNETGLATVKNLVQAFIDYPKPIIAVVNGPAIGIAATSAALCDVIYCSDKAYFQTPFVKLAICAEGASSYLFPRLLGRSKASELLLLGEKLSAQEAYNFGFVSKVIPHEEIQTFTDSLYKYGSLPLNSVKVIKDLIMINLKNTLSDCNKREMLSLVECLKSDEFSQAFMNYFSKSKL